MRYVLRVMFVLVSVMASRAQLPPTNSSVFGDIPPADYLLGMFDPETNDLFAPVSSFGIVWENDYIGYVRKDVGTALAQMIRAFESEHPTITLPVVSATRNYTKQESIWSNKWYNQYSDIPQPIDRALAILQYSSMPGTSRHHWGTDVDLYALENYIFSAGDGKIVYDWLQKNAASFGFCQPYTDGRCAGYNEERWHWSYLPLSGEFLRDWVVYYEFNLCRFIEKARFPGSQEGASLLAPVYVQTVNMECKAPFQ